MAGKRFDRSLMMILSVLLFAVLAMGCFLFPMSDPEKSVMDKSLLGTWVDENGTEALVFLPHDKRSYTMLIMKKTGNKWTVDMSELGSVYKAFITEAKGDRYLNIQFMSHALTYNPAQQTKAELEKLVEIGANGGEDKKAEDMPEKVKSQREAIVKTATTSTGMTPLYLIAKFKIEQNQLKLQTLKAADKDKAEYNSLKSMEDVRQFVLTKGELEDESVYTYSNQLKDK